MSDSRPPTLLSILKLAADYLDKKGVPGARLDAEVLLAHILEVDRIQLYVQHDRPLVSSELDQYRDAIASRAAGKPVAYITGEKEFLSHGFYVNEDVLIPRPETELLVETVIEKLQAVKERECYVLDLGIGSGVVAVCTALSVPGARVTAVDVSRPALDVARRNARCHGVSDSIQFLTGSMFSPLDVNTYGGRFHAIASNPPYVPTCQLKHLPREIRLYEPRFALDGGSDGLSFYRRIAGRAHQYLRPGAWLCLELGTEQAGPVCDMVRQTGRYDEIELRKDYVGIERVLVARRCPETG